MRHILCLTLALALAGPGAALADRRLSGAVTYPERIALPEGAEVAVEVLGIDGATLGFSVFPAGGLPAPFALTVPDRDLVVTVMLVHAGRPFRVAPTQVVPAGTGDVGLGDLTARVLAAERGLGSTLDCGPVTVETAFTPDGSVRMRWGGAVAELPHQPAASGARYGDGRDPETFVWFKDDAATVSLHGVALTCVALPAGQAPLSGGATEPGWRVDVLPDRIVYTDDTGAVLRDLPAPRTIHLSDGWLHVAGDPPLGVLVQHGPAVDPMTGMPYPWRLTVMTGDAILTGQGGAPEGLLLGEWRFQDIGGSAVPDGPPATLRFDADWRAGGFGGCNRYSGAYALTAEGISFGAIAATRMACAPAAMDLESRVLDVLGRTDRFGIDDAGALVLYAADTPIARLQR
ncbi:MAG: META domain-containing protein [Rhodobacteraceae bacterium]|nr:META domain-containing protein [Paracoccaceae bacterium]